MTKSSGSSLCIVGAGFSGLSLAYWAIKQGHSVTLFDESSRVGGLLSSRRVDGNLVESAANGFLWSDDFAELERDLGVKFIGTRPESRRRYIYRGGSYRRWPLGFFETLFFLWRLVWNWSRRRPRLEETIREWGDRVMGTNARHYVLETALQGIYAGQAEVLSASLILGRFMGRVRRTKKSSSRSGTHSHPEGMGSLATDLLHFLKREPHFRFESSRRFGPEDLKAQREAGVQVLLATPADRAAEILSPEHPELARALRSVEMNSVATATVIWPAPDGELGLPTGFGVLFPRGEGVDALGVLRNHHIFEGRSSHISETWIYSGASLRVRGIWENQEAFRKLIEEERFHLTGKRLAPEQFESYFWDRGIPHYTVQLERTLPQLRDLSLRAGVAVFGNYTGQLGLSRIFSEARSFVHERFGNV